MSQINSLIKSILREHLSTAPIKITRVRGGFNCAIYKVVDDKKNEYVAKQYVKRDGDNTPRLKVEYSALKFLWDKGIVDIPQPICKSDIHNIGIYKFIEGRALGKGDVDYRDIIQVTNFWTKLHALHDLKQAKNIQDAKEACFTIADYLNVVESRLTSLKRLPKKEELLKLHRFLEEEYSPLYDQMKQFILLECKRKNIALDKPLIRSKQTLSPSDFGFHNAIKKKDNSLVFHDFEYFGWDDPAKMIADFFLHPRMNLPYKLREYFYKNIYNVLSEDDLTSRLPIVYIILSFKWCLIMLNIFTHKDTIRGKNMLISQKQLAKAREHLNEIIAELEMRSFPLSLL